MYLPLMHIRIFAFRSLPAIALSIWVGSNAASTAETSRKKPLGTVVVANVVKEVEAVDPIRPSPRSLKMKDVISEESM